jgi:hypothetical protein
LTRLVGVSPLSRALSLVTVLLETLETGARDQQEVQVNPDHDLLDRSLPCLPLILSQARSSPILGMRVDGSGMTADKGAQQDSGVQARHKEDGRVTLQP